MEGGLFNVIEMVYQSSVPDCLNHEQLSLLGTSQSTIFNALSVCRSRSRDNSRLCLILERKPPRLLLMDSLGTRDYN